MNQAPAFAHWRKSTRSEPAESCVEVALATDQAIVGVRDSKDPTGQFLTFTVRDWETFIRVVREPHSDK